MYDINNIMSNQESKVDDSQSQSQLQVEPVNNICKIFANVHGREISESSLLSNMTNHIEVIMLDETLYTDDETQYKDELREWKDKLLNKLEENVVSQDTNTIMNTRNFVMGASQGESFFQFPSTEVLELLYKLNDTTDGFVEFDIEKQHELEVTARHTLRERYTRKYMDSARDAYSDGVNYLNYLSDILQNTTITVGSGVSIQQIKMSDILVYIIGNYTPNYLSDIYINWIHEKNSPTDTAEDSMLMLSRIKNYRNEVNIRIESIRTALKKDSVSPQISDNLIKNLLLSLQDIKGSYTKTYEWIITAYEGHEGKREVDGGLWHLQNFEPEKDNMNIKDREYKWKVIDPKMGFFLISLYLDGVKCFPTIPEGRNLTLNQRHNITYYYNTLDPYFHKISEEDGLKEFKQKFWAKFKNSIGSGKITLAEVTLFQLIISDYSVIYDSACRGCIDEPLSGNKRPSRTFTGPNPKTGPKTGGNHHQLGYKLINKNIHKNRISKRNKKNKPKRKSMNIRCNKKNSKKYTKKNRKHKNYKKYTKKNRKHKNNKNHKKYTKKNRKHKNNKNHKNHTKKNKKH